MKNLKNSKNLKFLKNLKKFKKSEKFPFSVLTEDLDFVDWIQLRSAPLAQWAKAWVGGAYWNRLVRTESIGTQG